ncbi:MAG: two-component system response regulator NarL [Gammaproteobacteria bacterium]|nr:MAG: two-component system response regulator NarL [Gammaproteobacteria bacterium]
MQVLLIDDHALFRVGLQELLERRQIDVIAVASGDEGVETAKKANPDVILLDIRMPDVNGLSVLTRLRKEGLDMPISMLTTSRDEMDLVEALRNGAQGYLLKDMEPDELINAMNDIVKGETVVAPDLTGTLAKALQGDGDVAAATTPFSDLTPREREILCHLAEGQSNKVIARHLGISDGTVKLHVKSILRKLDVHSRVEAAVMAVEQRLCKNNMQT